MVPVGRGSCARARLRSGCLRKEPLACSFAVGVLGRGIVTPIGLKTRDGRGIQAKNSKNDYFGDEHKKAASGLAAKRFRKQTPIPHRAV